MTTIGSGHTLKKFDEELATLRTLVLDMGALVEAQVRHAVDALEAADAELARETVERDREVDRMELKADEEIAQVLALRTPLGIDLRTVLTLSKTVNDIERIGDEAKKIAKVALRISADAGDSPRVPMLGHVQSMARHALSMLNGALDALLRLDLDRARQVGLEDDALDEAYKATLLLLKSSMLRAPETIDAAVQVIFAVKALERIGDHSKNIAEYVFYLVEGRDVRHPKSNPAFNDDGRD